MRKSITAVLLSTLLALVTVAVTGCFDRQPFRPKTPTAPPTTPESTWVEVCDTIPGPLIKFDEQSLSTDHPRMVLAKNIVVSCDQHLIRDTTRIDNYEATNVAVVKFLETQPGSSPYRRYYFRDALGDTLLVPDAATTIIPTTVEDVPVGIYLAVGLYKSVTHGTRLIRSSNSPTGTMCYLKLNGVLRIFCIECKMIKVPVKT